MLFLALILLLNPGQFVAENILVFLPYPFTSHVRGFQPLFKELARRGHNVTIIAAFATADPPTNNYHQILVPDLMRDFDVQTLAAKKMEFVTSIVIFWKFALELGEAVLQLPQVQEIIHSDHLKFDLIIVETFFQECVAAIGHKFNAPVINMIPNYSSALLKWSGNPFNPSYTPDFRLPFTDEMTFLQRVQNTICIYLQTVFDELWYIPNQQKLADKYFNYTGYRNRPPITKLLRNISVTLVQSDMLLFFPVAYMPSVVEVSGIHIPNNYALPQDIQHIMDKAENGVIFFSLGSHIKFALLPDKKIQELLFVFKQVPQTVLLTCDLESISNVPSNVVIRKWFPQIGILAHPNLKLFITHGGIHSMLETVHFGVPILGMPFFADQRINLGFAVKKNYGISSNFYSFTTDSLLSDIKTIITDTKYRENAKKISTLYHDRLTKPLDTAVYWVEYVLRHKRTDHFKSAASDLPWYRLYLIDVFAFICFVTLATFYTVYIIIRLIITLILGKVISIPVLSKNKKQQ